MMASPPRFIETERLRLVPWSDAYSDRFADLCADAEAMRFISRGRPLPRVVVDEILRRTREMWEQYGFGPWAALEKGSGRWIGRIGLNLLDDCRVRTSGRSGSSLSPPHGEGLCDGGCSSHDPLRMERDATDADHQRHR